jgi:hypothetical protein
MNLIYISLLSLFALANHSVLITKFELRKMYDASISDAKKNMEFQKSMESISNKNGVEEVYLGAAYAMGAQFVPSYMAKFKLVIKSKTHLDNGVNADPTNPETHFIRFSIEHHLPAYLGFSQHLNKDLDFVFQHLDFLDDDIVMKRKVVDFMLWTERCNMQQKIKLQAIKTNMDLLHGKK